MSLAFLSSTLFAITADTDAAKFEMRPQTKHVDVFDFSKTYPLLENIDIDARRKKKVEFNLTGEFPVLETLTYDGTFGSLVGRFTGTFPKLREVNFLCTSCAMDFNLLGKWERSCEINIRGMKEDIILKVPKDIGVIVHTKVGVRGKVVIADMKKKGWFGVLNKTYRNSLAKTSEVVLTINVEATEGRIIIE